MLVSVEEGKLAIKLVLSGTPFILKSNAMIDTGSKRFIRILISTDRFAITFLYGKPDIVKLPTHNSKLIK